MSGEDQQTARRLSGAEVEALFARHVAVNDSDAYLRRYEGFNFVQRFGPEAVCVMEFPRLVAVLEFERLVAAHGIRAERVLMLNGGPAGDPELAFLPREDVEFGDHEVDPERYDLHALRVDRRDYDFVLVSQTLEHLYNPLLALQNLARVMVVGGHVWTSVPTVSLQHQLPHHFTTGFTPIGLVCAFEQTGFEVMSVGQWGNAKYVSQLFDLDVIPGYYDLVRATQPIRGVRHLLRLLRRVSPANFVADGTRNNFAKPVQTWVLARKRPVPARKA